jgi:hypothetical protein
LIERHVCFATKEPFHLVRRRGSRCTSYSVSCLL